MTKASCSPRVTPQIRFPAIASDCVLNLGLLPAEGHENLRIRHWSARHKRVYGETGAGKPFTAPGPRPSEGPFVPCTGAFTYHRGIGGARLYLTWCFCYLMPLRPEASAG